MAQSRKGLELKAWTDTVQKNMQLFKEGNELMIRKHQKSNIKTSSYAITLKEMAQTEQSASIKEALECLSGALNNGENHRLLILSHLQAFVVDQFEKYPPKLKVQRVNIQSRNKAVAEFSDKSRAYESAVVSGSVSKQQLAKDVLEGERKRMIASEQTLNASVGEFEKERVADMKNFLKRYIQAQIYFFARELEGLTQAMQLVSKIDPDMERAQFLRKLKSMEVPDETPAKKQ